jgi:hypothetical protein
MCHQQWQAAEDDVELGQSSGHLRIIPRSAIGDELDHGSGIEHIDAQGSKGRAHLWPGPQ